MVIYFSSFLLHLHSSDYLTRTLLLNFDIFRSSLFILLNFCAPSLYTRFSFYDRRWSYNVLVRSFILQFVITNGQLIFQLKCRVRHHERLKSLRFWLLKILDKSKELFQRVYARDTQDFEVIRVTRRRMKEKRVKEGRQPSITTCVVSFCVCRRRFNSMNGNKFYWLTFYKSWNFPSSIDVSVIKGTLKWADGKLHRARFLIYSDISLLRCRRQSHYTVKFICFSNVFHNNANRMWEDI